MRIRVIGVPMDLGADRRGVDIGASAIRYAGLNDHLRKLGHSVHDIGNLVVPQPESLPLGNPRVKYLEPIVQVCDKLANIVTNSLQENEFPLIVGGDHSIALGSISGVARVHKNIGVIWIDAHTDFNTEETTPSGNVHGMILAALAGIGHRDLANVNGIHLSLDMDALDPKEAPGVGTPVRGGLTYREAHLAMEMIAGMGNLVSMDVVEVNPILDRENATASLAVELVLSALGKKIF